MDDFAAARAYVSVPLTDADVALYANQDQAPRNATTDGWLDEMLRAAFLAAPGNVAQLNQLIESSGASPLPASSTSCASPLPQSVVAQPQPTAAPLSGVVGRCVASREAAGKIVVRQNLPRGLTTVDGVLTAWEDGVDGLVPMRLFVGNKHPTIKLDRAERKQLNDHARIARKVLWSDFVEGIGREEFRIRYEVDSEGRTRTLKAIRVVLEREARASKST